MAFSNGDITTGEAECDKIVHSYRAGLNAAERKKAILSRRDFKRIYAILAHPEDENIENPDLQTWVQKRFILNGGGDVLLRGSGSGRRVVARDEIYSQLHRYHLLVKHANPEETWERVKSECAYIPKAVATSFVASCPICGAEPTVPRLTIPLPSPTSDSPARSSPHRIDAGDDIPLGTEAGDPPRKAEDDDRVVPQLITPPTPDASARGSPPRSDAGDDITLEDEASDPPRNEAQDDDLVVTRPIPLPPTPDASAHDSHPWQQFLDDLTVLFTARRNTFSKTHYLDNLLPRTPMMASQPVNYCS